jgi:glycerol-3-phosphate acyltransferase PlsY
MSYYLYCAIFAYFCGSIPFGFLLAKSIGVKDLRQSGSGNIGATNVWRVGGKKLGIMTFCLDAAKGLLPVMLAKSYYGPEAAAVAAVFAVLGHTFPVWLRFTGGKGVATMFAVLFVLNFIVAMIAITAWLVMFLSTKTSSIASITAMIAASVASLCVADVNTMTIVLLSIFVIYRHKENIKRLIHGAEQPIGR